MNMANINVSTPEQKELFVRDEHGLVTRSPFEAASELTVIYIGDDGWTCTPFRNVSSDQPCRVVNFNTSGHGHAVDQHALHVVKSQGHGRGTRVKYSLHGQSLGRGNESPRTAYRTVVYPGNIEHILRAAIAEVNMDRQRALCTAPSSLDTG